MATQKKPERFCLMGVAGSGKTAIGSRLAHTLGVAWLDGDDLHSAQSVQKMARGTPLTDDDRRGWLEAIAARIADARRANTGLVVACSALKRAYRDVLRNADAELRFVHLSGDRAVIARRMSQRAGHFMPASLLDSQLATLEIPGPDERAWTFDVADSPEAIVARIVERLDA